MFFVKQKEKYLLFFIMFFIIITKNRLIVNQFSYFKKFKLYKVINLLFITAKNAIICIVIFFCNLPIDMYRTQEI